MNADVSPLRVQRAPSSSSVDIQNETDVFSFVYDIFEDFSLEGPWDAWYTFKDKIIKPSLLGATVRELAATESIVEQYNNEMNDQICEAIHSTEFPQLAFFLTKIFNRLSDKQLNEVLSSLFDRCDTQQPLKLIVKLKTLLTLEKIESAVRTELPSFRCTADDVVSYASLSKNDIEAKRKQNTDNIRRTAYHYAISALDHFVNLFSMVFHLKNNTIDEGDPSTAQLQANMQYTALIQNLSLISGWIIALSLYIASAVITATICLFTAVFGGLTVYLYYNYIKPCPENVAPFKNIITEINMGNVPPIAGREKEIEEVINYLCSNDSNTRNHPLLVGASGVGKTQIVQGLAQRIASGNVPPMLQGKKLFMVNTSDLVSGSAWGRFWNFEKMLHIMKGYESEAIFFFDEMHVAFNSEENKDLGQKLKTLMDPGPGNLKFCIGATTIKEYEQFMEKDEAFNRRMPRVNVKSMEPGEVLNALIQQVYQELPNIIVEPGVVEKLAFVGLEHTEFSNVSQPYKSMALLNLAFTQSKTPQVSQEKVTLTQNYSKRDLLIKENAIAFGMASLPSSPEGKKREERREEIDGIIRDLEPQVKAQDAKSEHLKSLIKMRHEIHETSLLDAVRIFDTSPEEEDFSSEELKLFLLQNHYFRLSIFRQIENRKREFAQAPFVVTHAMVDALINRERVNLSNKSKTVPKETPGSPDMSTPVSRPPIVAEA